MSRTWTTLLVTTVVVATAIAACSSDSTNGALPAPPGTTSGSGGDGGESTFSSGTGAVQELTLDPPASTIVVENGAAMPVQLTATAGDQIVYPTSWAVDFGAVADVDNAGLVTAQGDRGGRVTITAEVDGITGSATVDVMVRQTLDPDGIPADVQDALRAATDADGTIQWAYPYDGTVWPQGLLPPEMQWFGGGASDTYYFQFTGEFFELEVFTTAPDARYAIGDGSWTTLSESLGDRDVTIHGARHDGAAATVTLDQTWTMAPGSLRGTVYYWANNLGRVVRIKPGDATPDDFLADAGVTGCTACHAVSANGKTMVIGGDVATSTYDLLNDQETFSLTSVNKQVRNWAMPALSPDGRYVVENNAPLPGPPGGSDGLWDAQTGQKLPGSGLEGAILDMPAFSPAGHKLVFTTHDGTHDLWTYDFDLAGGVASNPTALISAGSDPALALIAFPNVSPTVDGSTYVTYHRGTYPGSLDTRTGPGNVYLASADQPDVEWRLEAINGDAYPFAAGDRDRDYNYEPTFAPAAAGGYLWVVFTSRRTYGNRLTGAKNDVKQLWVAAIDPFPEEGKDPSHPAFYLPGQDPATLNMRGYWALDPCIQQGDTCTESGECCDGRACEEGVCGGPDTCAEVGEYCEGDGDCCNPAASCVGNECVIDGPR